MVQNFIDKKCKIKYKRSIGYYKCGMIQSKCNIWCPCIKIAHYNNNVGIEDVWNQEIQENQIISTISSLM